MPHLNPKLLAELIDLLAPAMQTERERTARLVVALGDCPLIDEIDYSGAVHEFVPLLVRKLADFGEVEPGKQALWALLESVRGKVGVDKPRRIDALEAVINVPGKGPAVLDAWSTGYAAAPPPGSTTATIQNSSGAQQAIGDGNTQIRIGDLDVKGLTNIGSGTMTTGDVAGRDIVKRNEQVDDEE